MHLKYWPALITGIIVTCAMTWPSHVRAQSLSSLPATPQSQALPLNKAIDLAIQNYPSIRARQSQIYAGQAAVTEAKDQRLPSLQLFEQIDAGTSNNLGAAYFSAGIVPSVSGVSARPDNIGTVSTGNIGVAYLQWQVTNFGGFKAAIKEAGSRLHVDSMDLEKEKFYIASMVLQSYLDLVRFYELTKVQRENLLRADTMRMAIRNYVLSGLRPGVDSSLAAAEYAKARLDFLDIAGRFNRSQAQLALLTGLDTSAIKPELSNDSLLIPSPIDTPDPAAPVDTKHPFLQYFHSIYENGQAQEQLIKKSYLPKVYFLGAGWLKGSSIKPDGSIDKDLASGLGYTRSNYLGGFGITYDLFNLRREKDRLHVQQYRTQTALHNFEEQQQVLNNAALQASIDLNTALGKYREVPIQLRAAQDAYAQRLTQYNAGLSNIIELSTALNVLNRAQTDLINTKDGVWRAVVQKAYAAGGVFQLLSTLK